MALLEDLQEVADWLPSSMQPQAHHLVETVGALIHYVEHGSLPSKPEDPVALKVPAGTSTTDLVQKIEELSAALAAAEAKQNPPTIEEAA